MTQMNEHSFSGLHGPQTASPQAEHRGRTMTWTAADIPDQTGRTAVVTGANGGLGYETALALAGAGATVVMAARDQAKAAEAESRIRAAHPSVSVEVVPLDLGDLASVRSAAEAVLESHGTVDLLVNNAGLMAMPERTTADGFEMQFGVNHLGHWAFTALLLPALLRADATRVVTVTSIAHHQGRPVDPANPHLHGRYKPWRAYGQAKLANFHFGLGLQKEFAAAGVRAASLIAHPGLSNTDLQARTVREGGAGASAPLAETLAARTGMSAEQGARPQLRAATDPKAKGGDFYGPLFGTNGPAVRRPVLRWIGMDKAIATLWRVSERETGISLDVAGAASAAR
jgi:NAD(P)-dependent dehydrogenase (short-subunit alcohol dehydrogenase family)